MWTPPQFKTVLLVHQPKMVSITTNVSDIFKVSDDNSKFILIEGAPGIGKATLAREIAYIWACKSLLSSDRLLLLLFSRNPEILKLQLFDDLANRIFGNGGVDCSDKHAKSILDRDGRNVAIILDGCDKLASTENYFLINNLLDGKVMPQCTILVTSQPTVLVNLHESANTRVDIMGFTEENKRSFLIGKLMQKQKCYRVGKMSIVFSSAPSLLDTTQPASSHQWLYRWIVCHRSVTVHCCVMVVQRCTLKATKTKDLHSPNFTDL